MYGDEKVGKTALLKEVAWYLLPRAHELLDGVFYIDLAKIDPRLPIDHSADNLGQIVSNHTHWKKLCKSDEEFYKRVGRSSYAFFFDHVDAVSRKDYVIEFVDKLLEQCPNVRAFVAVRTSYLSSDFSKWQAASSCKLPKTFSDDLQIASYLLKAVGYERLCHELVRHGEIQYGAELNADVQRGVANSRFIKSFNRSVAKATLAATLLQVQHFIVVSTTANVSL